MNHDRPATEDEEDDYGITSFTSSTFASQESLYSSQSTSNINPFESDPPASIHPLTLIASLAHLVKDIESPSTNQSSRATSTSSRMNLSLDLNTIINESEREQSAYSLGRAYSSDSVNESTSQSASGSGRGGELQMPSMNLNRQDSGGITRETRPRPVKLLMCGKSMEDKRRLVNLLDRLPLHDEDLSQSMLSISHSSQSHHDDRPHLDSPSIPPAYGRFEEILSNNELISYWTTVEPYDYLLQPLETLNRYISSDYPSTEGLLNHVVKNLEDSLISCLFIFSSPPTSAEIASAKSISHLIPIVPILLLHRSPKAQKTEALRLAVTRQLDYHIDWIAPLYLLPHHHFDQDDSDLASSQELSPPSSTSSYPLRTPSDLDRLQDMISSSAQHDYLKRIRGESFLAWREVEVAARGKLLRSVDSLPKEWNELKLASGEKDAMRHDLKFSRRVAERRLSIAPSHISAEELGLSTLTAHPRNEPSDTTAHPRQSTSPTIEHTTPRCQQRSLANSVSSSPRRTPSPFQDFFAPTCAAPASPSRQSYLIPIGDPFHLPSLWQLVGLNLRFAILPPKLVQVQYNKFAFFSMVGAVFLFGVAVGNVRSIISLYR